MSGGDPRIDLFYLVRDEVRRALSNALSQYSGWIKLLGNEVDIDKREKVRSELRNSIESIEWDLEDLDHVIAFLEQTPRAEKESRKEFIKDTRAVVKTMKDHLFSVHSRAKIGSNAVDHDAELDKALQDGHIDLQAMDSVLVGVGGAGKTHTLDMMARRPPPVKRVSTTCTRPPVQMMVSASDEMVVMVGKKRYFDIIVDTAREVGSSLQLSIGPPRQYSPPSKRRADVPNYMRKLEDEMHRRLYEEEVEEPKLLHKLRWNRLTDSGGQPQFLEILPIFIHNISLGIIVIKLNERLDCFPMMEFYNKDGNPVGKPYKSCYSQEQVVHYFMMAFASQAGEGRDIKFLFIGTHKDRIEECDESLKEKNAKLQEMVLLFNVTANVVYNGLDLIFPINAKTPGTEDWEVMKQVWSKFGKCAANVPRIKVPIRWFTMELVLQHFVEETEEAVLLESKCWELVANYHFDKDSFKAALRYLHQVKHIYYYEDGMKGLVVAKTQIIQDKLCEVVGYNIAIRNNTCGPVALGYEWKKFCECGIMHTKCLNKFSDGYIYGVFSSKELLQLFQSLYIVSEVDPDEYLMPCVLPTEETPCCNPEPETQIVPAMVVEVPGGPMLGLFCGLVCYLLHTAKWKLPERIGVPIHMTRSTIFFSIPGYPGRVTFNDPLSNFFTLTFHGPIEVTPVICPLIREAVLTGIKEVSKNLNYLPQGKFASNSETQLNRQPKVTFLCPCKATPPHPALISRNRKHLMHPGNAEICESVTDKHKMWLIRARVPNHGSAQTELSAVVPISSPEVSPLSLASLTLLRWKDENNRTRRFRLVRQISGDWWNAGLRLGLSVDELGSTEQRTDDNEQRLAFIFTQWMDKGGHPPDYPLSWDGVCELLYDLEKGNVAEELEQALYWQSL